jgi:WD40 repeat protein
MAEQAEPVRRRVAVKVIKPGMESGQILARFEAERQALAMMDHPNIARVFDAGVTEDGRPYFVMELVHGVPITRFCEERKLPVRRRLELFRGVCQAIQHAHQKGVIHRDIKPSNVLVCLYDDKPVAKVIDFGVAKALDQSLTERTLFTQFGAVVGTLEYMSPEQAVMNQLGIDTRSDVYSLGVLLYELLTGTTPLERSRLRAEAFDQVLRLIREEEPPRPSTRLSTMSGKPRTETAKLAGEVRGELDWIAMKALEKDRARRYETASALAKDIERHLAGEPVEACPPTWGYRLGKVLARHRAAAAVVAAFALVLVTAAVVSVWFAVKARTAEAQALSDRDVATDAKEKADTARKKANAALDQTRRQKYALAMSLIQTAWQNDDVARVEELLDGLRPAAGEEDLRGFEWHYWRRQIRRPERSRQVRAGSLSMDGERLALIRKDGETSAVEVVEAATGHVLFSRSEKGREHWHPSFSQDGRRIAWGFGKIARGPGKGGGPFGGPVFESAGAEVFDIESGKLVLARGLSGQLMGFSADCARALINNGRSWEMIDLTAADAKPVKIDGREVQRLGRAISPDGKRLAFHASLKKLVRVVDASNGKVLADIPNMLSPQSLQFSPDGNRLAASDKAQVYLWELKPDGGLGEQRVVALPLPSAPLRFPHGSFLVFSPDGARLAAWDYDAPVVRILDGVTGTEQDVLHLSCAVRNLAFSRDGALLRVLSIPFSREVAFGNEVWQEYRLAAPAKVSRLSRTPIEVRSRDGARVASRAVRGGTWGIPVGRAPEKDSNVILIRDRAGKDILSFRGHAHWPYSIELTPSGKLVFSLARPHGPGQVEARLWEADTGKIVFSRDFDIQRGGPQMSPDGRFLLLPGDKGSDVVECDGGRLRFSVGEAFHGSFSPDSHRVVTMGQRGKGESRLWDMESGRLIRTLPPAEAAQFSTDGKLFALVAGGDAANSIDVHDSGDGGRRLTIPMAKELARDPPTFRIGLPVFSPDGHYLVCYRSSWQAAHGVGSGTIAEVWDIVAGKRLNRLSLPSGVVLGFAFSPDGKRLACLVGRDRRRDLLEYRCWELPSGAELLAVKQPGPVLSFANDRNLTFSPDGHRLLPPGAMTGVDAAVLDATPLPDDR